MLLSPLVKVKSVHEVRYVCIYASTYVCMYLLGRAISSRKEKNPSEFQDASSISGPGKRLTRRKELRDREKKREKRKKNVQCK